MDSVDGLLDTTLGGFVGADTCERDRIHRCWIYIDLNNLWHQMSSGVIQTDGISSRFRCFEIIQEAVSLRVAHADGIDGLAHNHGRVHSLHKNGLHRIRTWNNISQMNYVVIIDFPIVWCRITT